MTERELRKIERRQDEEFKRKNKRKKVREKKEMERNIRGHIERSKMN